MSKVTKKEKKMSKEAFNWFLSYLRKYYLRIGVGFVIVTLTSLIAIINPKVTGEIVDEVIGNGEDIDTSKLGYMIGIMIAFTVVGATLKYLRSRLFESASQRMLYDMRDGVYRNLLQKDFAFYNKNRTGDLMSRQTGDMMAIRHCVAYAIPTLYECLLLFTIALVMIFITDYRIGLCMIAVLPITAYTTYRQSRAIKPKFSIVRERFSSLNAFVQENVSGNRVVKAFAKEDYEIQKFNKENDAYRDSEIDAANVWVKYVPIFDILSSLLTLVLILAGGIMVIKGGLSLGEMVMINGYLWMLNNPLRMCGWLINDYLRFLTSVEKIYSTVSAKPDICQPRYPKSIERIQGNIEFKNVSYSAFDDVILRDINFKINAGETVGIIGPTGSGKSTIMNLLCRFFDVSEGEVLVDGVNVKDIELHRLRDSIGMAMQDVFLFSDTVEGNIAYGVPDCTLDKVIWAAKIADADGFIREMPDGYDTIIGERGVGLSGGQKQRISLARALIKEPSIVILDDTTSAVDMETETQIQNSLKKLEKKETVFIIAHRISSIKDANQILVLDDGRIVEHGSHDELIAKKGQYYRVFKHQYGDVL